MAGASGLAPITAAAVRYWGGRVGPQADILVSERRAIANRNAGENDVLD
jgi:hypothetical protein